MVVKTLNMENKEKVFHQISRNIYQTKIWKNLKLENFKLTEEEQNRKFTEGYILLWILNMP